jgi:hypothetical protein
VSATAIRNAPLLLRFLADDFSVLIIRRPRVYWASWLRKYHVIH